jgi:serine/threonine protein kinase
MPNCPQCGKQSGAGDPAGLCPKCLILGAFDTSIGAEESATQTITPAVAAGDDDFGRYQILRPVGEGGMGTVYLAQQLEPIHRRVALKVVKLGMDTAQVLARFNNERQALAIMDHPNIAQIFDAGATTKGRPYFVMEYIEGVPITQYCDGKRMTTRDRLSLFLAVCRAVQHAHQKGVIHRDLKPSNVLVTEQDGTPIPKVIDFGIAKATDKWAVENTLLTQFGQIVGTPEYASPEQADTMTGDIDEPPMFIPSASSCTNAHRLCRSVRPRCATRFGGNAANDHAKTKPIATAKLTRWARRRRHCARRQTGPVSLRA